MSTNVGATRGLEAASPTDIHNNCVTVYGEGSVCNEDGLLRDAQTRM